MADWPWVGLGKGSEARAKRADEIFDTFRESHILLAVARAMGCSDSLPAPLNHGALLEEKVGCRSVKRNADQHEHCDL